MKREMYKPPFVLNQKPSPRLVVSRQHSESTTCSTLDECTPFVTELAITYRELFDWEPPKDEKRKKGEPPTRQRGLKGDLILRSDVFRAKRDPQVVKSYKMVTVWEHWTEKDLVENDRVVKAGPRWTRGMMTPAPGIYAGFARVRNTKLKSEKPSPSIWVIWRWDDQKVDWVPGVPTAKPGGSKISDLIYIHIGNWPSNFSGCIGPGKTPAPFGVWSSGDAMWEILEAGGVDRSKWVPNGDEGDPASASDVKWFLIRIEDARARGPVRRDWSVILDAYNVDARISCNAPVESEFPDFGLPEEDLNTSDPSPSCSDESALMAEWFPANNASATGHSLRLESSATIHYRLSMSDGKKTTGEFAFIPGSKPIPLSHLVRLTEFEYQRMSKIEIWGEPYGTVALKERFSGDYAVGRLSHEVQHDASERSVRFEFEVHKSVAQYICEEMNWNKKDRRVLFFANEMAFPKPRPDVAVRFAWLFRPKGEWDHKPKISPVWGAWNRLGDSERKYYYDIWSNIHFGYIGHASGLRLDALLRGANIAQWCTDFSPDPERDKAYIRLGYDMYHPERAISVEGLVGLVENLVRNHPGWEAPANMSAVARAGKGSTVASGPKRLLPDATCDIPPDSPDQPPVSPCISR